MPPKQRTGSVAKQCEECGGSNPVACKSCTACGADFYAGANDKPSSPEEASSLLDAASTGIDERRRSERVKREKPDYYDALEFENKRKTTSTPTREKSRREKLSSGTGRSPKCRLDDDGESRSRSGLGGKRGSKHQTNAAGRATLTWKKGKGQEEDEEEKDKKKRKRKREDTEDDLLHIMDELPPEKTLQCQVSLAEINRKLGAVMHQPI